MILLAHHIEPYHFPVLGVFFLVGFWIGWRLLARWTESPARSEP